MIEVFPAYCLRLAPYLFDHFGRGMILWIANDRHSSAKGSYHITLWNRLFGVVSALGMNIRLDGEQQFRNGWFIKNRDEIDGFQRRHDFGALVLRQEGAAFSLQSACLLIRINCNNQDVPQSLGCFQVADMPGVQDVEAPVGKNDPLALAPERFNGSY